MAKKKRQGTARSAGKPGRTGKAGRPGPAAYRVLPGLLLGLALLAVAAAGTGPIGNNDYGLHLRLGQEIAETLRPVRVDFHSYTLPGALYPDHEWLTQVAFYELQRGLGDGGMVVLKGLLIGAALSLMAASMSGPPVLRLALVVGVALLAFDHAHMRPHLLSWVMAGLLGLLLERRLYWPLPLLFLFWGNMHGSVLLGVGVAGLHFLEQYGQSRERRYLLWAACCPLVPLLNPSGLGIYALFFEISGHTSFIGEWQPYTPAAGGFWLLLLLLILSGFGLLRTRPFNYFDLAQVSVLLFLAFQSSRNGVVAAIFLAPLLARWYGAEVSRWSRPARLAAAGGLLALVLLLLVLRVCDGRAGRFVLDHELLPVAAVRFMQSHDLSGPMFNDYNFGGYLLWQAWPEHPVFIDGRTEVYKGPVLEEYLRVSGAEEGWEQVIERYGIAFFVIRPERELAQALLQDPDWDLVYFDYNAVIYARGDLFPHLKRLRVVSPYGHRDPERVEEAVEEITYLLEENPLFFGGYKILAFLRYRQGDYTAARQALLGYLELHPEGLGLEETRSLIEGLERAGVWPY